MNDKINLTEITKRIYDTLKKQDLDPISYSISVTLKKDDFDIVADKHPDYLQPGIIIKTSSEDEELLWSIQIIREVTSEDLNNFNQG